MWVRMHEPERGRKMNTRLKFFWTEKTNISQYPISCMRQVAVAFKFRQVSLALPPSCWVLGVNKTANTNTKQQKTQRKPTPKQNKITVNLPSIPIIQPNLPSIPSTLFSCNPWPATDTQPSTYYECNPVFDEFVDAQQIPILWLDFMEVNGRKLKINKFFPHLSLYNYGSFRSSLWPRRLLWQQYHS